MFVHTRTHEAADDERSIMRESAQQQSTLQKAKENRRETPKRSLSNKFQFGFLEKDERKKCFLFICSSVEHGRRMLHTLHWIQ